MTAHASEIGERIVTMYAPTCGRCGRAVCCDSARHHGHTEPEACWTMSRREAMIALAAHYATSHGEDPMGAYFKLHASDAWWV